MTTDMAVIKQIKEVKDDKFSVVILIIRYVIELVKKLEFSSANDIICKLHSKIVHLQSFLPHNLLITNVGRRCIACIVEVLQDNGVIKPAIPLFEPTQSSTTLNISSELYKNIVDKLHAYEDHICSIRLKPCDLSSAQPYSTDASIGYCSPNDFRMQLVPRTSRAASENNHQNLARSTVEDYKGIRSKFSQAIAHGDIVLAVSPGIQLCNYLTALYSRGIKFELIILENEPLRDGLQAALYFSNCGISTSLIADSALMMFLPKTSAVFLEPEFVLNNGGAIASSGSVLTAMAAKVYNIPVNCLCETFQFCTAYPSALTALILSANPSEILPDADSYDSFKKLTIKAPLAGYIEPEFIDYYMTCEGIFKPKAIFQLLQAIMNV